MAVYLYLDNIPVYACIYFLFWCWCWYIDEKLTSRNFRIISLNLNDVKNTK